MQWWQWLVGILLFIVALGVLIGIHELGHLSAAKMFHVYCLNYSIGFGPKLIASKRTDKHETIWCLRAIPLGGFVAMYGEGVELDSNEYIPPSRSIEGIARYKRAIIIGAGVFLNFILGFILIALHNGCFDHIYFSWVKTDKYNSSIVISSTSEGVKDGDALHLMLDPIAQAKITNNVAVNVFLVDTNVTIPGLETTPYVMVMRNNVTTTKIDPDLSTSFMLFKRQDIATTIENSIKSGYKDGFLKGIIITNEGIDSKDTKKMKELDERIRNYTKEQKDNEYRKQLTDYYHGLGTNYSIDPSTPYEINDRAANEINCSLTFDTWNAEHKIDPSKRYQVMKTFKLNNAKNGWDNIGIGLKRQFEHYGFAKTMQVSWNEWCASNSAIFNALGRLITGDTQNIGGIITIAVQSSQVLTDFGFERYLFLWGTISCNLAIINLMPFPGLDGWSLIVIAYEAITKKQIPLKIKSIISFVGLILLFGLMLLIIIQDIVRFV